MMICEPKRGWRNVLIMQRRTKIDFAHAMRHIVECYPDAEGIRFRSDNLNTHKQLLYEAFAPEEVRAIARKLEFTTPQTWQLAQHCRAELAGAVE